MITGLRQSQSGDKKTNFRIYFTGVNDNNAQYAQVQQKGDSIYQLLKKNNTNWQKCDNFSLLQ